MTSDLDLLRQFARENSQDAFSEIVRRHLNLVYSAALRQVRSPQLAEEIAQSVFSDLARNANKLTNTTGGSPVLTAWLYSVTRRTAIDVIRKESRRQLREQIAVEMNDMNATANDWTQIAPLLDDAMAALDETERSAILLRYFENKNLREVGASLNISDDAAQKRVSRAVERLREFFSKQKITIGASGLVVLISVNAVQSAPISLAATISTSVALTTTTIGMTMIHKILIAGFAAAAIGSGICSVHLQKQIGTLQQQQTSLNQQIQQLSQERDDAKNQLAAAQQENEQSNANETELLRLRGEVTRLRHQQNVLPQAAQPKTNSLPNVEKIQILLTSQFVSLPTEDLQSLGIVWKSDAQGGKTGLLTKQQFKVIHEALQGASDVNLISTPRVVTLNGEPATISMTRAFPIIPVGGTNADTGVTYTNVGTSLNVFPNFSTNSSTFSLNLDAKLTQLTGDPSQPDFQTIQITNQIILSQGQVAVLETEIPNGAWSPDSTNVSAEPKSLLIFVTPTVVDSAGNRIPKYQ
jgi:RNA polymerase sigma factor (sigma-70 family)